MDDQIPTISPTNKVIQAPIIMDFSDAMREVMEGRKVRREEWPVDEYGILADGWLSISRQGLMHRWMVSDGDILATDWVVVKETN